jgi:hypothetical protein
VSKNRKLRLSVAGVITSMSTSASIAGSQTLQEERTMAQSKLPRIAPTEELVFLLCPIYDKAFVISQFGQDVLSDVKNGGTREYKLWLKVCLRIVKAF